MIHSGDLFYHFGVDLMLTKLTIIDLTVERKWMEIFKILEGDLGN